MFISLPNFASFSKKSPSVPQSKDKGANGSNNYFYLIENNFRFLRYWRSLISGWQYGLWQNASSYDPSTPGARPEGAGWSSIPLEHPLHEMTLYIGIYGEPSFGVTVSPSPHLKHKLPLPPFNLKSLFRFDRYNGLSIPPPHYVTKLTRTRRVLIRPWPSTWSTLFII